MGAGVAILSLSWLPTARPARAEHGTWQMWGGCDGLGSWVNDDDCRGCNQGSKICCCNDDGYHRADGCHYKHRPNACKDNYYDGWTWKTGECCAIACDQCYTGITWRCTDGFYRADCDGEFKTSICRVLLDKGPACHCPTC